MRRFIAHLLIISLLAINVAWAVDECALQYSNEASGVVLELGLAGDLSADSHPDTTGDDGVCNDPCIGWLHLVAITPGIKLDYFPFTRQEVVRTDISFHSLDKTPPIRPPQI